MTMFVQLKAGVPVGFPVAEENFRQLFPSTSFPTYFTADAVEPFGYGIYDFSGAPDTGRYEKAVEELPTRNEFGIWRQSWVVVPMSDPEKLDADKRKAEDIRNDRNYRLFVTDWTQLADAPVDAHLWATYRQALRDVTAQVGFPWEIVWPSAPSST
jgi:hypothetical protein